MRHGPRCSVSDCVSGARKGSSKCIKHGGGPRCSVSDCSSGAVSGYTKCRRHGGGVRCSVSDCSSSAVKGGKCQRHGGGARCSTPDCLTAALKGGKCVKHGGGARCSVSDCLSLVRAGDKCGKHGARCSVSDCVSGAYKGGKCIRHGPRCSVSDCSSGAKGGDKCIRHGPRCSVSDCSSGVKAGGKCRRHGGARCSVSDCSSRAVSGYTKCIRHKGGVRCSVSDCVSGVERGGKCRKHGGGSRCSVSDCLSFAHKGGKCFKHGGGVLCITVGCLKSAQAHCQGFCSACANREGCNGNITPCLDCGKNTYGYTRDRERCFKCYIVKNPDEKWLHNKRAEINMCRILDDVLGVKTRSTHIDFTGGYKHPMPSGDQYHTGTEGLHALSNVDFFVSADHLLNADIINTLGGVRRSPLVDRILELGLKAHGDEFKGVVIEYDGARWHVDREENDRIKRSLIEDDGYLVFIVHSKSEHVLTPFSIRGEPLKYIDKSEFKNSYKRIFA
jgi:hypothetical protein